jgi:hypothetical protein
MEEASAIFSEIFHKQPAWRTLLQRLPAAGLLNVNSKMLKELTT